MISKSLCDCRSLTCSRVPFFAYTHASPNNFLFLLCFIHFQPLSLLLCSCLNFTLFCTPPICSCTYPFCIQQIHSAFPVIIQLQWLCKYSIFCYLVLRCLFCLSYLAQGTSKAKLICASLCRPTVVTTHSLMRVAKHFGNSSATYLSMSISFFPLFTFSFSLRQKSPLKCVGFVCVRVCLWAGRCS